MRREHAIYPSPLGPLRLVEGPAGPLAVSFRPGTEPETGTCAETRAGLDRYFAGRAPGVPSLDALRAERPDAAEALAVWAAICEIPFGETCSYGEIGRRVGLHPREVGRLTGANLIAILVPCHRVVGSRGALVGYGGGLPRKRWLLSHEARCQGLVLTPPEP